MSVVVQSHDPRLPFWYLNVSISLLPNKCQRSTLTADTFMSAFYVFLQSV